MTDYGCGHSTNNVIVIDSNMLSIAAYLDWKDSTGWDGDNSECWACYCKCNYPNGDLK